MTLFDIEFYTLEDGSKPVEQFLDSLNSKMRVKAVNSLELLEEFGNLLREPHSKYLSDGIFELRIKFASDISRIFYFFVIRNQSTSAQPPSLVTMAGRVQNIPTLAPIHCPSLARKGAPNDSNFFPSRL